MDNPAKGELTGRSALGREWGCVRSSAVTVLVAAAALATLALACGTTEGDTTPPDWTPSPPANLPGPPGSLQELVDRVEIIVVGTVGPDPVEARRGSYDRPGEGPTFIVTDYRVTIERVVKGAPAVAVGDEIVMREFGSLSGQQARGSITMSQPGDRRLFALGQNSDGTYGPHFGEFSRIRIDGELAEYASLRSVDTSALGGRTPGQLLEELERLVNE